MPAQEQGCAEYSDKVNTSQTLVSLRQIRKCSISSRQYIDVNITIEREVHWICLHVYVMYYDRCTQHLPRKTDWQAKTTSLPPSATNVPPSSSIFSSRLWVPSPGLCTNQTKLYLLSQRTIKKIINFIFPTKYVFPKSLKVSHWLSKLWSILKCPTFCLTIWFLYKFVMCVLGAERIKHQWTPQDGVPGQPWQMSFLEEMSLHVRGTGSKATNTCSLHQCQRRW